MVRAERWRGIVWAAVVSGWAAGVCGAQGVPLTRVSVDATGTQVAGASRNPSPSADGRFVAFSSTATTLVASDTNGSADVFVKDRQTGAVTRVSVRTDGTQQIGDSSAPDISSDGRFVTFTSSAALVTDDSNACGGAGPTCPDVYVHDRTTGATTRISVATGGAPGGNASGAPRISATGRYVVFESAASTLVSGDTNGVVDVFLHDRQTATTTRASVATNGTQGDRASLSPTISDDGTRITFLSDATTLDASTDPLPCTPTIFDCVRVFVRTVGVSTARVGLTPTPYDPFSSVAQAYRVESAAIAGDGNTVAAVVIGSTREGALIGSIDTLALHSLVTGVTTGALTFFGVPPTGPPPPTGPVPPAPLSRYRSPALSRTGRFVAACFRGFSASGNTWGVVITDVAMGLGTSAAGSPDGGGYLAAQPDCEGAALSDDGTITFLASSGDQIVANDTNTAMDVFVQERDVDPDGLPVEWETYFAFDPGNPADAGLDPDGDGVTNRQEFEAVTHPRGLFTYYLAEGAANAFFSTDVTIFNPNRRPNPMVGGSAIVMTHFFGQNGRRGQILQRLFARDDGGRALFSASSAAYPTLFPDQAFSTTIESDRPLAIERTVTWGGPFGQGYGSHAETATAAPMTSAHFAEGATHGPFDLFYLLQNPSSVPVTATITYLRPAPQAPIVRSYTLLPNSRRTIYVDQEPGLDATDVSARIEADQPIFAERSMYMSTPGQPFAGGTASAGIAASATQWFIAEGATGTFFDLYILIGNPSAGNADVTITYLLPDGTSIAKTHQVAGQSRSTISVKSEDTRLAATAVSASITSTNATPIVVERAMWWPSPNWYEGTVTAATTTAATRWALAGGYIDNTQPETETYLLVANPGATIANVTFDLGMDGVAAIPQHPTWAACRVTVAVPARGRYTTGLRDLCPFATAPYSVLRIAGTIESDGPPIVVERSTYWSAGGQFWAAGASTLLTRLP